MQNGWNYYNHALIPTTAPHEKVIKPTFNKSFWKVKNGFPILARWTDDWDCGYETQWWYVIKDTPFDIEQLKAKRRYEINKGKKNFEVKRIKASDYKNDLLKVQKEAYSGWPEKYRPRVDDESFKKELDSWEKNVVYGGFDRESGELVAYTYLIEYAQYLDFCVLRAIPKYEKKGINAAMVAAIVEEYNEKLGESFYINDGSRAIRHETAFQDYLEKYFGFRKAYCKLHIKYRKIVSLFIKILYPFRNNINGRGRFASNINAVLKMDMFKE